MKNKILVLLLVFTVFLTSGCGANDYIKDDNNKIVQYSITNYN